jgi:hypothetical protein
MKVYVLAGCYTDKYGNGETSAPAVFTTLEAAQNALDTEFNLIPLEALDETMDTQCTDFTNPECVERDGGGLAYVYYKDGSMSQYEIYEVEVE